MTSGNVVITLVTIVMTTGKVATTVGKVVTQPDTFETTAGKYKTRFAEIVASNRTKASTFAIEKIAKELALFPSRLDAF